jgi:hypothetical protein
MKPPGYQTSHYEALTASAAALSPRSISSKAKHNRDSSPQSIATSRQ